MPYRYFLTLLVLFFSIIGLQSQNLSVEQYISKYKDLAVSQMKEYKIPASIILAQAINESANGNSDLAVNARNHFGIKCQDNWNGDTYYKDDDSEDECFRKYKTVKESFQDHSEFIRNRTRYSFLFELKSDDYQGWAKGLKTAGYATNPNYPQILISTIDKYKLHEFDLPDTSVSLADKGLRNKLKIFNKRDSKSSKSSSGSGSGREIIFKNNIKTVIAKKGDTYISLAQELDMFQWQILKYNDLISNDSIHEGDLIYLQPKRKRSKTEYHIYQSGESLRMISQIYGIKLKSLLNKNNLKHGSMPSPGQKLSLRKKFK